MRVIIVQLLCTESIQYSGKFLRASKQCNMILTCIAIKWKSGEEPGNQANSYTGGKNRSSSKVFRWLYTWFVTAQLRPSRR